MSKPTATRHSVPRRPRPVRAAVLGATLLLAAACGASSSSVAPSPSGPASPAQPSTSRSFQVSTPDGQVSVSLDGQLPPNWPSGFPTPPDAAVAGSGSLGGSAATGQVAVYSSSSPPSDVFSFYSSNPRLTTTGAKSAGAGASYAGSMKVTAPYTGSVTVVSHGGETYAVVVLRLPGASPTG